jgi:hypothetical protein
MSPGFIRSYFSTSSSTRLYNFFPRRVRWQKSDQCLPTARELRDMAPFGVFHLAGWNSGWEFGSLWFESQLEPDMGVQLLLQVGALAPKNNKCFSCMSQQCSHPDSYTGASVLFQSCQFVDASNYFSPLPASQPSQIALTG